MKGCSNSELGAVEYVVMANFYKYYYLRFAEVKSDFVAGQEWETRYQVCLQFSMYGGGTVATNTL